MRRKRWRSRVRKRGSKGKIILISTVVFLIISLQSFVYIEKNLRGPLMEIARIRVKQIATEAINNAITEHIATETDFEKLIDWKMDNDGKIAGFMLNYAEHMKIASATVKTVQGTLDELQKQAEYIPLGQAMRSAIIASYGPNIPIHFVPVGAVKVELNTRQIDAGINMVLVEVYIRIIDEVMIIIPFESKPEIVATEIPISYLLVVGDVPMYYVDGKGNPIGASQPMPPAITLPDSRDEWSSGPDVRTNVQNVQPSDQGAERAVFSHSLK